LYHNKLFIYCLNEIVTHFDFALAEVMERGQNSTQTHQTRAWCFTLNYYTEDEAIQAMEWAEENAAYACFGWEHGDDGHPHIQGYFRLSRNRNLRYNHLENELACLLNKNDNTALGGASRSLLVNTIHSKALFEAAAALQTSPRSPSCFYLVKNSSL